MSLGIQNSEKQTLLGKGLIDNCQFSDSNNLRGDMFSVSTYNFFKKISWYSTVKINYYKNSTKIVNLRIHIYQMKVWISDLLINVVHSFSVCSEIDRNLSFLNRLLSRRFHVCYITVSSYNSQTTTRWSRMSLAWPS